MKLLLFDIDGTILKVKESLSKQVFADLIKKVFGQDIPEKLLPNFAGMTDLKIITDTAEIIGITNEEIEKLLPLFWKEMIEVFNPLYNNTNVTLLPGITELINYYHNSNDFQLGLLTGNLKDCAYMKLRPYNLENFFPFGAFGDENYDRNKLPSIAINRANSYITKELFYNYNSLIIGDSPMDIMCAKSNNIKSLNVATGSYSKIQLNDFGSDYCFDDFNDTNSVINKIEELLK
jgi:phosphoglycolate phosphatase-like HAD superfamily hydrolase